MVSVPSMRTMKRCGFGCTATRSCGVTSSSRAPSSMAAITSRWHCSCWVLFLCPGGEVCVMDVVWVGWVGEKRRENL
jgi:hypothetical protein